MVPKNYGLIETSPSPKDWRFGAAPTSMEPLVPSRDWLKWKPTGEKQNFGFETYACVSFSAWNCIETLYYRKYGRKPNWSDRFTAKMSDTVLGYGNTAAKVAESIRKDWSVQESRYPFKAKTDAEYYKPITKTLINLAVKEKPKYSYSWHWVAWGGDLKREVLWDALQYAPLQVSVLAWEQPKNGIYVRSESDQTNHMVTILKGIWGVRWTIFDHYDKELKDLEWDFRFGSALQHLITKN